MEYEPGTWDLFGDIGVINTWLERHHSTLDPDRVDMIRVMKNRGRNRGSA